MEKYGKATQATDDNVTWRMNITCWIPTATDTHSEYAILIAFPLQQWLAIPPQCYVYSAFLLLLYIVGYVPALSTSHFQAL